MLGQDGNPPLYYLLLHGWMQVFGTGEAATRALSLVFALLAVPASFWAGPRSSTAAPGALAAAGAAGSPFLTYYAQETRMYSLVVLLSILASASFVLAFVRGDRAPLPLLGLWLALLLYTHTWGLFLTAAMARRVARAVAARARSRAATARGSAPRSRCSTRRGCRSSLFQAAHTAAPWAERPSPLLLLGIPGGLFGHFALPLLALAVFFALRRRPPVDRAVRVLAGDRDRDRRRSRGCARRSSPRGPRATSPSCSARCCWRWRRSSRAARAGRRVALVGVAVVWLMSGPPPIKSNVRTVSTASRRRSGPATSSSPPSPSRCPRSTATCREGAVYLTPMGLVSDPRQTDWRDGLERLRAGQAETRAAAGARRAWTAASGS